jgi:hypothetical protein
MSRKRSDGGNAMADLSAGVTRGSNEPGTRSQNRRHDRRAND